VTPEVATWYARVMKALVRVLARGSVAVCVLALGVALAACGGSAPAPADPGGHAATPPPGGEAGTHGGDHARGEAHAHGDAHGHAPAKLAGPIEPGAVERAVGATTQTAGDVVKVTFPRKDVAVLVDGWAMPPFMGLTSWVGFSPGREGVAEAMIMGDLVLFEDEVSAVMSTLLEGGAEVTALHNHFFFDRPAVYFMHVGGEGEVAALGDAVKRAMKTVAEIRTRRPKPAATFGAAALPPKSTLDRARLGAALATELDEKDGMLKAVWGRDVTAACGCPAGKAMGVNTWAAFAGSDANAVALGDFAVTEGELQGVLKVLRAGGIHVVAIHHHMTGESPRVLFLHYWGRGAAADLAATIRRALATTAHGPKEA
jgi:hypothetical protein